MRRKQILICCLYLLFACLAVRLQAQEDQPHAFGADVSFLPQEEASGIVFKDNGVAKPGLQILHDHGYNWIRMRIFVRPEKNATNLPNTLAYSIAVAKQAKALGFKVEVGFHYSAICAHPPEKV
jgi:arabinogalactan endo-1,4-beta-galactosidase